jgi:hypothetical protein
MVRGLSFWAAREPPNNPSAAADRAGTTAMRGFQLSRPARRLSEGVRQ